MSQKYIGVKQATKAGIIPMKIGGGMRFKLSHKQVKKRKSTGRWEYKSDNNNIMWSV